MYSDQGAATQGAYDATSGYSELYSELPEHGHSYMDIVKTLHATEKLTFRSVRLMPGNLGTGLMKDTKSIQAASKNLDGLRSLIVESRKTKQRQEEDRLMKKSCVSNV